MTEKTLQEELREARAPYLHEVANKAADRLDALQNDLAYELEAENEKLRALADSAGLDAERAIRRAHIAENAFEEERNWGFAMAERAATAEAKLDEAEEENEKLRGGLCWNCAKFADDMEALRAQLAEAREALLIADKAIDSLLGQEAFVPHWDYLRRVHERIRAALTNASACRTSE